MAKCPYQEERGATDVELLLAHSAEINIRDREGMTPLHLAVTTGSESMASLLISKGANIDG